MLSGFKQSSSAFLAPRAHAASRFSLLTCPLVPVHLHLLLIHFWLLRGREAVAAGNSAVMALTLAG